jgi:hypothetical protein
VDHHLLGFKKNDTDRRLVSDPDIDGRDKSLGKVIMLQCYHVTILNELGDISPCV